MPILIKRYQNRKLYNTQSKHYVTLEEIENLVKNGEEIQVIDNLSGDDITAITLSQVILELEKNQNDYLPIKILLALVQSGGHRFEEIKRSIFDALIMHHHYDAEIERRVDILIGQGEMTQAEGARLLGKLLSVQHQDSWENEDIQWRVFEFLREQQIPSRKDLQALVRKIEIISEQVDELNVAHSIRDVKPVENQIMQ